MGRVYLSRPLWPPVKTNIFFLSVLGKINHKRRIETSQKTIQGLDFSLMLLLKWYHNDGERAISHPVGD